MRPMIIAARQAGRRDALAALLALTLAGGALLAAAPALADDYKVGALVIHSPWSRATPAGAKVAVGYLSIDNTGGEPDRLVGLTAEIAGRAEIHAMAVDANGVMTMRPVAGGLEIPAGGEVTLKPGSFHAMFMDLEAPAVEGERFKGTLTFEKAGSIEVEYEVQAIGGG